MKILPDAALLGWPATPTPVPRELLTVKAACQRAQVCHRTMRNWVKSGKVESCKTAGGGIRIVADTLWRR